DGEFHYFENKTPSNTVSNERPEDLILSTSFIDENIVAGSSVASLSTLDSNPGDTHTYSLVSGDGDADNNVFLINSNQLMIVDSPDFELNDTYSIRLQTMDSGGLTFEKTFILSVNDLPEPFNKPELVSATIDGDTLFLAFNKPLDSNNSPSLELWTVAEDGKNVNIKSIEQRASVGKIILILEQPVDSLSEVTLGYRDLDGDQITDVVQDIDGNDLASIDSLAVDNQTERATTELGVLFAEVDGNKVLVAFNRELDDVLPSSAPFRFKSNGKKVSIEDAVLDSGGRQLILTLSRFIRFDENSTLIYTDAVGDQRDGVVQDIDGNDLASFNMDVENSSPQESELQLISGEAEDNLITLDFNEQLSGTRLSKKLFKVKVNSKKAKVDSADLFPEDGYIEININKNIEFGDDVLISYKDLNGDQSDGVIQDGYGTDLASFKNFAPDVTAPDEQGPILEEAYIDDGQLYLEFDELIAPGKVKGSRIKLRADGKRLKVKGTTIEDEDTVAVFELKKQLSPITQELFLSYKDPKRDQRSGVIQDLIGNDMESLQNIAVEIVAL
ncbi:SwmB domain-containing protein, partial [Synechococcus sp. AH-736-M02]|nr:SwmB domain-containing protein [Synechococcus sp. AH-736-M02]